MAVYFMKRYNFEFLLRVDDDYFVCLDRLTKEIVHRPQSLYWGYFHCITPGNIRADEGFLILSRDLVEEILSKEKTTLICGPYGGLSIGHWVKTSKLNVTNFMDNNRLAHEVTSSKGNKYLVKDICERYIGLHGTYHVYMQKYWDLYTSSSDNDRHYIIPEMASFDKLCRHGFTLTMHGGKLCKDKPVYGNGQQYKGREPPDNRKVRASWPP